MDFYNVLKTRRSIRKFQTKSVPQEVITRITKHIPFAPTWANKQGVKYLLISNPEKVSQVSQATGQEWTKTAPLFLVVCISPSQSGKNQNGLENYPVDAAIGLYHVILSATNEGLGTCWIGWFDESQMKKVLDIYSSTRIIGLTPIGYPDETPKPQKRKSLDYFLTEI